MPDKKTLLAVDYPTPEQWKLLIESFSPEAIAHKLLLASIPYVFRNEPLKFALFRRTIADAFGVDATDVFIVGSALAGRSLKANELEQEYSPESDIDTLVISEPLFTSHVMRSLEWVKEVTTPQWIKDSAGPQRSASQLVAPTLESDTVFQIGRVAMHACRGIWRPDSLPKGASIREEFFDKFNDVSLKVLGLQLSEDTVAKVNGRIARSFGDAVADLAENIRRLGNDLDYEATHGKKAAATAKVQQVS